MNCILAVEKSAYFEGFFGKNLDNFLPPPFDNLARTSDVQHRVASEDERFFFFINRLQNGSRAKTFCSASGLRKNVVAESQRFSLEFALAMGSVQQLTVCPKHSTLLSQAFANNACGMPHLPFDAFLACWDAKKLIETTASKCLMVFNCGDFGGAAKKPWYASLMGYSSASEDIPISRHVRNSSAIEFFDFFHVARRHRHVTPEDAYKTYCAAMGEAFRYLLDGDAGAFSYNFLLTNEWALLVPRRKLVYSAIGCDLEVEFDGLAFGGIVNVLSEREAAAIKKEGICKILKNLCYH